MKADTKTLFFILSAIFMTYFSVQSQNNYKNGNEAYMTERLIGFNDVTIHSGTIVYHYDSVQKIYKNDTCILIPDLTVKENGRYVLINTFFGFGFGGVHSDTSFTWDNKTLMAPHEFDVKNIFVSPLSSFGMHYAKALQYSSTSCYYDNCYAIIDGPEKSLAYNSHDPKNDTFNIWAGEELIDAGDLKFTGFSQKISQQQMDTTPNRSYCVDKYGHGWRLPTDMEVGHKNDNEGTLNGLDSAYMGNSAKYLWTSSLYKTYTVKRWVTLNTDGFWENCGGFLYVTNNVRCVFPGYEKNPASQKDDPVTSSAFLNIFPNPGNGIFYFQNARNSTIYIYNLMGKLIQMYSFTDSCHTIDISSFPDGIYICHIHIDQSPSLFVRRIIKISN